MAAPASASNGVFVVVPPNNTGISQPQGTPGTVLQHPSILQYGDQQAGSMNPTNQPQPVLKQENPGNAERFLKAEVKTLAVIQILIGVIHIGFGGVLAVFVNSHPFQTSPAVLSGYPFWGGITFITSGSLSIEAEKNRTVQLVKSSLGMNIVSSIFSLIGIVLFLVELTSSLFAPDPVQKQAWTGMTIMLSLFAATEFSISVSVSHIGCQATCCGLENAPVFFVPYHVNTDVGAPSAAASSTHVYINAAATPRTETESGKLN